jgi:Uncharacterized protein conserved in bacteria
MYEKKIAIVLRNDLQNWQKLNVTSFLASSIAIAFTEVHGNSFSTNTEGEFLPFINQPILIYKADNDDIMRRVFSRSKERALHIGIYPQTFFSTKSAEENYLVMEKFNGETEALAGIVIYGETKKVYKALDGLKLCD